MGIYFEMELSYLQEKLTTELLLPAREKFFGFMTKFLKESTSGMFAIIQEANVVDISIVPRTFFSFLSEILL